MMNNKNNRRKDKSISVSPSRIEKCFYSIENQFQNFEILFILNQLRKRSTFKLKSDFSLRPFGIDWLIWFLNSIHTDLGDIGQALNRSLIMKMVSFKDLPSNRFISEELQAFRLSKKNL